MASTYGGLTAYPATIEEGLAAHGYVPPRARVYRPSTSSRGEWIVIGIMGVLGIAFVGLVVIPYVQRVGSTPSGLTVQQGLTS